MGIERDLAKKLEDMLPNGVRPLDLWMREVLEKGYIAVSLPLSTYFMFLYHPTFGTPTTTEVPLAITCNGLNIQCGDGNRYVFFKLSPIAVNLDEEN